MHCKLCGASTLVHPLSPPLPSGIEHIQHLQKQRQSQEAELELLKKQLGQLNSTIK